MTDEPTDAWACAEDVRTGARSAQEIVDEALDRAAADTSNAFTVLLEDTARDRARRVDAGELTGPLAGVPISVKDHVWLEGAVASNGSRALADFVAPSTATCVRRLLDAGAVVVGKTNNPEFCYRGVTANELWGETTNPHDPARTAGGSSGGAAASVAAGIVPLAVGTDGGGSIRIPSAFCGVHGFKPTFGLVPKMPGFRGWPTLSVTGPIAASVRDLALALSIMAGPSPSDNLSYPAPSGVDYLAAVAGPVLEGLRIGVADDLGIVDLDPDVRTVFADVVDLLEAAGVEIVDPELPEDDPCPLWDAIALPEGYASEGPLVESQPGLVGDDAASLALAGAGVSAQEYLDAQVARADYAEQWSVVFDEVDVLLTASMPVTAFGAGRLAPDTIDGLPVPDAFDAWCALALPANLAGLPAASVPIGTGRNGLPIGLQVLGPRWGDDVVLRTAALVDRMVRGAVSP